MFPLLHSFFHHCRHLLRSFASPTLIFAILLFSIAWGAASSATTQSGAPPLFLDPPETAPTAKPTPPPSQASQRQRLAQVDLALLADPQRNQTLLINLFEDVTLTAERTKAGPAYENGFVWVGQVPGKPLSAVILVSVNDAVAGTILDGSGHLYEIRYAGNSLHVLRQLDSALFPQEAPSLLPPALLPEESPPASAEPEISPLVDDPSRLDIMIVFSDDARAAAGGTDAMLAEVYLAVELTNQAYVNSNVTQRLSLVYTGEIAYAETGNSGTDLGRLQNASDGQIDQVPTLRDRYGADLVTFLLESLDYCGRGYVMTNVSNGFAPYAYNVVARDCAGSNLSMAHELGHNMGGQHDWYAEDTTLPYTYAHGYVNVADEWRTIMAYNSECAAQTPAVSCTRILHFSNPSVTYGGDPTGIPAGTNTSCVEGDLSHPACDANMRLTLNNTAATVAGFRATSPGRNDVWMKDTWEDTGAEPDPLTAGQAMWLSPYLWVRHEQDTDLVFQHEHENPILGRDNYVYTKLHNGSESPMSGTLILYWANQSVGLEWQTDWAQFTSVPVTIPANSSKVVEATWKPEGSGHYCLLARWVSEADPMHPEISVVDTNVRTNNNIIWKNVQVIPILSLDCQTPFLLPVIMRNVGNLLGNPEVTQIDLILRPSVELRKDWLGYFNLLGVDPGALGNNLVAWEGFEWNPLANILQLVDPTGGILHFNLKYREEGTINLITQASCESFPSILTNLPFDLSQIVEGDQLPIGGVAYLVSLEPPESQLITVTGSKFEDRDVDALWDEDGSEPPLEGWEIQAANPQGQIFSALTDQTGVYRLELPPGIYTIYEIQQPGWVQTAPTNMVYELDLSQAMPGSTIYSIDFGNYQPKVFLPLIVKLPQQ